MTPTSYRPTPALLIMLLLAACSVEPDPTSAISTPTSPSTQTPEPASPMPTSTTTPPPTATRLPTATPAPEQYIDEAGNLMQHVPAGEFTMGSEAGFPDELPVHAVYVDAFYIDKYEVTNEMYAECVDDSSECRRPRLPGSITRSVYFSNQNFANYPVLYVDWWMARAYCTWRGARLPTEAEWEKAARGTDGRVYPWGDEPATCDYAVMDDLVMGSGCGWQTTSPVGSIPEGASPYGVLDMAGNVWEWVFDWDPYATNGAGRVLCGGGHYSVPSTVRAAKREVLHFPMDKNDALGFRCGASAVE